MRSRGTPPPKKRRKNGSLKNRERTRTWVFEEMLTTAGVTSASIGASDCMGWPSTIGGGVARAIPGAHANRAHATSAVNRAKAAGRWADACMAVAPCGFRRRLTDAGAAGSAKAVRIRHDLSGGSLVEECRQDSHLRACAQFALYFGLSRR